MVPNDRHNFGLPTKSQEVSSYRINGQMRQRIFLLRNSFHEVTAHPQTKTQCNRRRALDTYICRGKLLACIYLLVLRNSISAKQTKAALQFMHKKYICFVCSIIWQKFQKDKGKQILVTLKNSGIENFCIMLPIITAYGMVLVQDLKKLYKLLREK